MVMVVVMVVWVVWVVTVIVVIMITIASEDYGDSDGDGCNMTKYKSRVGYPQ